MRKLFLILTLIVIDGMVIHAQRQMEYLDRGVVAIRNAEGNVFVSWRSLYNDAPNLAFNLYRANGDLKNGSDKTLKLNDKPITKTTNFLDRTASPQVDYSYYVVNVVKGKERESSRHFMLSQGALPYLSIPLQTPTGYSPNDGSVADLDGDGEYEIVLHGREEEETTARQDITDPPIFQAYKLDGTIDYGRSILARIFVKALITRNSWCMTSMAMAGQK